jgi:hypothetical protein
MLENLFKKKVTESYYRIQRYENGHYRDETSHLAKILKEHWLVDASKKGVPFTVKCIFGEISNPYVIQDAAKISNCSKIEVIFGPELANEHNKEILKDILEHFNSKDSNGENRITLYSCTSRPEYHSVKIANSYMYEDQHEPGKDFLWETAIPNAKEDTRRAFDNYFNKLLHADCREVTLDKVKNDPRFINIDDVPVQKTKGDQ